MLEAFAAATAQLFGRRQLTPSTLRHSTSHVGPILKGAEEHSAWHVQAVAAAPLLCTVTPCKSKHINNLGIACAFEVICFETY
jgi:hypothetical protein